MKIWSAPTPNGWKVAIMIEELRERGLVLDDLEVTTVDLRAGEQFSAAFTAVNPNQKIPALQDGDITLMESCAILQYLAEKYPSALLPEGAARWQVLQWLYWQAANLGPVFGNKLSYTRYLGDVDASLRAHPLERFGSEAQRLLRVFDKQLQGRDYICGDDLTIADIACFPWIRGWKWSKIDITSHARVVDWLERLRNHAGVKRGVAYGAPSGEAEQWSEDTKKRYVSMGAGIASNDNIKAS